MDGFKISGFIIKKLCLKWYQINIRRFEKLRAKTRNKYFKKVSEASKNVDIFFTITKVFQYYSIFSITIKPHLTPSTEDYVLKVLCTVDTAINYFQKKLYFS